MTSIHRSLLGCLLLLGLSPAGHAAELTVSAAASLGNAFREIARQYEARYPDAQVQLNFGGSGALLAQMAKGAPVDVFASADQATMTRAVQQGLVDAKAPQTFTRNALVLIVPADSTLKLQQLADLNQDSVRKIAIGNPASVPAGSYARQALEQARLWQAISARTINTQNVRQALDYVARGEVDAGFVYGTDAHLMKERVTVRFEVPTATPVSYPIAPTADSRNHLEARRFIDYVLSPPGQAVLARYSFKPR